jgi:hypothetical protein
MTNIALDVKSSLIFWDITPCNSVKVNRQFGEHTASIFRDKGYAKQETSTKQVTELVSFSPLKMVTI